jgi:putative MATE family efflux protein
VAVPRAPDRRIAALALAALPALAAEPLYVLVDTAVVGHLGAAQLSGLAIGALLLTDTAWLLNFLAYGTTAAAARLYGARRRRDAVEFGAQATMLAVVLGVLVAGLLELVAQPAADLIGKDPAQKEAAVAWLRIAALGMPCILVTLAGQGWMRGVQDLRQPLVILLGANGLSAVLCPLLVFPAGLGIEGSAIANVIGQTTAATLFLVALYREGVTWRPSRPVMRAQLSSARDLGIRTAAFQITFLAAAAVASRMGTAQVAAHQIALQLWTFLALVLDSLAIAAQALIGEQLGGEDALGARATARRLGEFGLALGVVFAALLTAGHAAIPALFTDDPAVRDQAAVAWPWFVATQPLGGLLFALDGVLIGAGDVAFMRNVTIAGALGGFLPMILAAGAFGWGLGGIWAGLFAFVVIRTVAGVARTAGGRWAVTGAANLPIAP